MEKDQYYLESNLESFHWWFYGRRVLLKQIMQDIHLEKTAYILDIGCSSGTNLRCFKQNGYHNYLPIDISQDVSQIITKKGFNAPQICSATDLPFANNTFDFISATDVLEHVDNDCQAIEETFRVLKPDCMAYFTVPCHQFLWGSQDIVSHHLRRYKRGELKTKLISEGFDIVKEFYFNSMLLIPILLVRGATHLLFKLKILSARQSENRLTGSGLANKILARIFSWECLFAYMAASKLPGVSCGYVVRKPKVYQQNET